MSFCCLKYMLRMSFYGILKAGLCIAKALQQSKYNLPLIA